MSQLYFIHVDHLNTPRLIADQNQTTVWRWDQAEPFGDNPADEDPDGNSVIFHMPLRFPGQYLDKETNLAYNYYRDYDPGIGRYVQSDPIGLLGGPNTYAYVANQPLRHADPTGRLVPLIAIALSGGGASSASALGGLAVIGGAAWWISQSSTNSGGKDEPELIVIPGGRAGPDAKTDREDCPPDDWCRRNQESLEAQKKLLDAMFASGWGASARRIEELNADIRNHNARCPNHKVKPYLRSVK